MLYSIIQDYGFSISIIFHHLMHINENYITNTVCYTFAFAFIQSQMQ